MDGRTDQLLWSNGRTDGQPSHPIGCFQYLCSLHSHIMTTGLISRKLIRGNSTWTLTRFSDSLFIAKNSFGKKHVFRSGWEMTHFEDFLLGQGFAPIERGRSLATLKKVG